MPHNDTLAEHRNIACNSSTQKGGTGGLEVGSYLGATDRGPCFNILKEILIYLFKLLDMF